MNLKNKIFIPIIQTFIFIPTCTVLWFLTNYLVRWVIHLLDITRGLEESLLQAFLIETLTPGFASFIILQLCGSLYSKSLIKVSYLLSIVTILLTYYFLNTLFTPQYENIVKFYNLIKIGTIVSVLIGSYMSYLMIDQP